MNDRRHWRPGQPRTWEIGSQEIELDDSVDHLIVVSDLHAYREPLAAVDAYLDSLSGPYRVVVNGDLFEGGIDATATVDWARARASGRTTRGNHDSRIFSYLAKETDSDPPSQWKLDAELGSYQTLSAEQLAFVEELPDQLMLRWRGRAIRILHGHQSPKLTDYTDWRSTTDQLMERFYDSQVDLTVIGHTHYPFVRQRDGAWLANSGSIAVPINRWRTTGPIHNRCATDDSVPDDDARCSLLSVTQNAGQLTMQIVRFDYDRRALLDRYALHTDLSLPMSLRKVWIMNAFHDRKALAGE